MNHVLKNGTQRTIQGKPCVYYDGYWIRYYPAPEESLANKKLLIDSLTRRAFHHTESGINTPGSRLDEARIAYEQETDPHRKRVNGAMLAGALFNRATDIFTAVVDLEERGVKVSRSNELMKECSGCFKEALELGKQVKHHSGHEGIDELWGEPFKAFTLPIAQLFDSRYQKIAQTMRDIDRLTDRLLASFENDRIFSGVIRCLVPYAAAAKLQIETMKQDPAFFTVWPTFVATREHLESFPDTISHLRHGDHHHFERGVKLINASLNLITYLSEARVPMPKSTAQLIAQCDEFDRRKDEQPH